jgi:addiction module HigA family antidote
MKKFIQKNASHPGRILWEYYLSPKYLNVTEAAAKIGITRPSLSAIINGRTGISPMMAVKLSKALKTSREFWMNLQSNYELSQALEKNEKTGTSIKSLV